MLASFRLAKLCSLGAFPVRIIDEGSGTAVDLVLGLPEWPLSAMYFWYSSRPVRQNKRKKRLNIHKTIYKKR